MGRPSRYNREFREQAVELARCGGKSVEATARDLGISGTTLGNWIRQDRVDRGESTDPEQLTSTEKEELRRLRRENAQLRMEREILKKAAAFFVQESTR
jgi:transposase